MLETRLLLVAIVTAMLVPHSVLSSTSPQGAPLDALPPNLRRAVIQHSEAFLQLPDGRIVDRTVDLEYRRVREAAYQNGTRLPDNSRAPKATRENIEWGLAHDATVTVEPPPRFLDSSTGNRIEAVLIDRAHTAYWNEQPLRVVQVLDAEGTALVGRALPHKPSDIEYHVRGLPRDLVDGQEVAGSCLLVPDDPPTYTYTTASGASSTKKSYRFYPLDEVSMTRDGLAGAITDGRAKLLVWKRKRVPDGATQGHWKVIWECREVAK